MGARDEMSDTTMIYVCPDGHESKHDGFCRQCGQPVKSAAAELCPECGTLRVASARFCEACRFDFRSREAAEVTESVLWLAVQIDRTQATDIGSVAASPVDRSEELFRLDLPEIVIGRVNDGPGAALAEVEIADSGISRRHLKILRHADGTYSVADVNSTNGTWLNDVQLEPGVEMPIQAGDELMVGEWTRLSIRDRG